jgi:hypothetical protein
MRTVNDEKERFVWRRAFRSPTRSVVRAEVIDALGVSKTAASTLLNLAVDGSTGLLQREGNKVCAPPWAEAPHWADEADLMECLDRGRVAFAETGLRAAELPVSFSTWSSSLPAVPGALTTIVGACTHKHSVFIRYVGLRAGDKARFRRSFPVALERMGGQWRLVAHDLDAEDFPLRTYVLSRITGASPDPARLPRGFIPSSPVDFKQTLVVDWDLRLNEDQKQALRCELGIGATGATTLNSRDIHEFLIRFGGQAVAANVVWPPLRKKAKTG